MAKKRYPRSTLRRILKTRSNRSVSKNVDLLVFLNYTLFIHDLLREASVDVKRSKRRKITADGIKEATGKSLMRFRA